jgi:hypothetical protein
MPSFRIELRCMLRAIRTVVVVVAPLWLDGCTSIITKMTNAMMG